MYARLKETGHHTVIFAVGGALQQAVNFVLLPVYTQYLTPSDFGVLSLLLIAGSLISLIPSAVVGSSLIRSYYDHQSQNERSVVVSSGLLLSAGLAALLMLSGFYFSVPLAKLLTGDVIYSGLVRIVIVGGAFSSITTVTQVVFRVQGWSVKYVSISLITMLLSISVTLYLVVLQGMSIAGVIWGTFIGGSTSVILSLIVIRAYLVPSFSLYEMRKMVSYGVPLIPTNVVGLLRDSGDRLIIQAVLGPSAVGIYALARRLGQVVQSFVIEPFNLVLPVTIFSAEHDLRAKDLYARLLTYYLLITGFICLIISVSASDLLRLIATPDYWPAAFLVPWMCLASILYGMRGLLGMGIALFRKTYWYLVAVAIGAAVYFGLLVFTVPVWGLIGAAISLAIANGVVCLGYYVPGQRIFRQKFEVGRLMKLTGVVFLLAPVRFLNIEPTWLSLLTKITLLTLGMPLTLFAMQFFDASERKHFSWAIASLRHKVTIFAL
jgi:O-antigen/teichoic acid export membrane protein